MRAGPVAPDAGSRLAAAALTLVGAPFRLHGRDPASGLDCVGVLAEALARCGWAMALPNGYALRATTLTPLLARARMLGFHPTEGPARPGDVLLLAPGSNQHHLAIVAADGAAIHAHAGLGRVVHGALPADWALLGRWRLGHPLAETQELSWQP